MQAFLNNHKTLWAACVERVETPWNSLMIHWFWCLAGWNICEKRLKAIHGLTWWWKCESTRDMASAWLSACRRATLAATSRDLEGESTAKGKGHGCWWCQVVVLAASIDLSQFKKVFNHDNEDCLHNFNQSILYFALFHSLHMAGEARLWRPFAQESCRAAQAALLMVIVGHGFVLFLAVVGRLLMFIMVAGQWLCCLVG